jgi:hypothetical protein
MVTTTTITAAEIKQFQQAISTATWKLGLDRFAEATGWNPEHGYTQDQFRAFQTLRKSLSQFDPEVLVKLIEAGRA